MIVLYILIGCCIGILIQKLLTKVELIRLTKQLKKRREQQLHHQLTVSSNHYLLSELLEELSLTLDNQNNTIIELQENKQQLKTDLMSISHDLRTPLTAIYGYLQLLNDDTLSPAERQYYLNIATQRTEMLQRMIQDLFYLGKLEANTIEHDMIEFDLDELLKEQIAGMYQLFYEANIELTLNIEENTRICSDEAAIKRLFNNILLNSIQHGQHKLHVEHTRTYTRFSNPIHSQENIDINRVFSRHYTGSLHRSQNNSGLGLTICYEICQQLGHHITAQIENGHFILTIVW